MSQGDPRPVLATYVIELEGAPPRPNMTRRGGIPHNAEQLRRVRMQRLMLQGLEKKWKTRTGWALAAAGVPKADLGFARITSIFFRRNMGVADAGSDLESLKPILDGIVAYGLIKDDNRRYCQETIPEERRRAKGAGSSVRIIIEQLGTAEPAIAD